MSKSPYLKAKCRYWAAIDQPYTWDEVLDAHLSGGLVVSNSDYFLMARVIDRDADHELIADPYYYFPEESANAWFVCMLAGVLSPAVLKNARDLPYIMFCRFDDKLRVYSLKKFNSLIA